MNDEMQTIQEASSKPPVLSYLSYASHSDVGKKREENQDSYGVIEREAYRIFVVADGMGGVKGGAVASQLAIQTFEEALNDKPIPENYIRSVKQANATVFAKGQEEQELSGMGTTFLALCFSADHLHVLHVGDSRAYRFREEKVEQLTHDHTLIQELVDAGALSEDQAEDHPVSHMLTRSLGPAAEVAPDCTLTLDGPLGGDRYLICSDGLYNLVDMDELPALIVGKSNEEAVRVLVDEANERGGIDNITAMLITVSDEYPFTLEDLPEPIREATSTDDTQELDRRELERALDEKEQGEDRDLEEGSSPSLESSVRLDSSVEEKLFAAHERNGDISEEDSEGVEIQENENPTDKNSVSAVSPPMHGPRSRILPFIAGVAAAVTVISVVLMQREPRLAGPPEGSAPPQEAQEVVALKGGEDASVALPEGGGTEETAPTPAVDTSGLQDDTFVRPDQDENETQDSVLPPRGESVTDAPPPVQQSVAQSERVHAADTLADLQRSQKQQLSGTSLEMLEARQVLLMQRAERLEKQLSLLREPLSGDVGEILRLSPQRERVKTQELRQVRAEIDIATRRLAVWYGRKRRMEHSDPLSLSVEVAAVSETVGATKRKFDQITWEYLKKAEAFRYEPENLNIKRDLVTLRQQRQEQLGSLSREIETAIREEIQASDEAIAKLTLKRDHIEEELRSLRQQEQVARVIANGTERDRDLLIEKLSEELDIINAELQELASLSPRQQEALATSSGEVSPQLEEPSLLPQEASLSN
jgi:serine/threonine protein phosphatase PrpC